jgi:DNA polymerase-3 subunit alpha
MPNLKTILKIIAVLAFLLALFLFFVIFSNLFFIKDLIGKNAKYSEEKISGLEKQISNLSEEIQKITGENKKVALSIKEIETKKGTKMHFVKLSDMTDSIEMVLFPKISEEFKDILNKDTCVVVKGKISEKNGEKSILVDKIKILE